MAKIIAKDMFGNTSEHDTSILLFRPSIYGIAINENNEILISPTLDGFDFPGGGIDKGENHIDALIREVKEESGLDITVGDIITSATSFFKDTDGTPYHAILLYYFVTVTGGEISTSGFDPDEQLYNKAARWVSIDELEKMKHCTSANVKDELLSAIKKKISLNS